MIQRPRVLVVDDDAAMREMLVGMLECAGFDAEAALDADAALFALQRRPFAAVICDIHMPSRDGFSLARALRWVRGSTPLVLMTSFGGAHTRAESQRSGAGAFLSKPFSSVQLRDAIDEACTASTRRARASS